MKFKVFVLGCLIAVIVLFFAHQSSVAKSKTTDAGRIGVVDIKRIFQSYERNAKYRKQAMAEQERIMAELEKLSREIDAGEAGLRTLKPESSDYFERAKELLQKRASLQAQQEFYKRQIELKDMRWTERLYGDILTKTGEVAGKKSLDMVADNSKPELPAMGVNELMLAIRTHKIIYDKGCLDITDEVMALVDAEK